MTFTEPEAELSASEVEAARREFLGAPPEILDPNVVEPTAPVDDEDAAIEELLAKPPAGEVSAPGTQPAPAGTADPYAAFGGEEAVRTAHQVQESLRTVDGVRALVANGLQALGYSVDQIRTALDAASAGPPAEVDPFADLDDDEPITIAQARQLAEAAAAKAVGAVQAQTNPQLQQVQEAIAGQQAQAVRNVTDAAVVEALGPVPTDAEQRKVYAARVDAIVNRGAAYYDPSQWSNPDHIRQAVQRAHTEIEAENEARFQAYLQTKRASRQGQPPNIAGGAGSDGPLAEPKSMAEAQKQARESGFFG